MTKTFKHPFLSVLFEETEIKVGLLATKSQGHYGLGEILMEAEKLGGF